MIIVNLFSSFIYSYYAAFLDRLDHKEYVIFIVLDSLLTVLFLIDCVLHFFVEYKYP